MYNWVWMFNSEITMRKPTKEEESFFKESLRYDPETGELWWVKEGERRVGRPRDLGRPAGSLSHGYLVIGLPKSVTGDQLWYPKVHRVAWFLHHNNWPDEQIDHINGDRKDNRIENLRLTTSQQNNLNRGALKGTSSKYKGVDWHKATQKWRSSIKFNRTDKHLGVYVSEEDAARAYDKAARELHGDYARLNFPEEHEQGAVNGLDP